MSKFKKLALNQFDLRRVIGTGAFSRVYIAKHLPSKTYCCLKQMSKQRMLSMEQVEHVQNERYIMTLMDHPNILRLYGTFQDRDHVYLMTEFIGGGEVFAHLYSREDFFDLLTTRFYAAELLIIIEYVHSKGVVYRDLKPENLLFDDNGHLKLIDFGFAKQIEKRTYTLCGTPAYLAPEVILGDGWTFASDWWSYGCILYEFVNGRTPFQEDDDEDKMYAKILEGKWSLTEKLCQDGELVDLITGLLKLSVDERLGSSALGAVEIKQHPWFEGIDWDYMSQHRYDPVMIPDIGPPDPDGFPSTMNFPIITELDEDEPLTDPIGSSVFEGF